MKAKKFNKKLSLNKKTVANLNNGQMNDVLGGVHKTTTTAPFCQFSCVDTCRITCDCTETCTCSECGTICGGPYC